MQSPGIRGRLNKPHTPELTACVNDLPEAAPICQKRVVKNFDFFSPAIQTKRECSQDSFSEKPIVA